MTQNRQEQAHPSGGKAPSSARPAREDDQRSLREAEAAKKLPPIEPLDEVDEASIGSFPASDPPGYGTGHA